MAPANKAGKAYFKITHRTKKDNRFQVCYGTKIQLSRAHRTTIAPDISIQKFDSPDTCNPNENMVELIFDAKYKNDEYNNLKINVLHEFMQIVNALGIQKACDIELELKDLGQLKSNCLITNGGIASCHDEYCKLYGIKQIGGFRLS
jgi:hypothetical protein